MEGAALLVSALALVALAHDSERRYAEFTSNSQRSSIQYSLTDKTSPLIEYQDIDRFCLAKNIFHEARGESTIGKYAIAQVTLNRVISSRYPDTVCEVVMQPHQFSWTQHHSKWSHPDHEQQAWQEAKHIADKILEQGLVLEGMEHALFYHTTQVVPAWASKEYRIATIDNHMFYNNDLKR